MSNRCCFVALCFLCFFTNSTALDHPHQHPLMRHALWLLLLLAWASCAPLRAAGQALRPTTTPPTTVPVLDAATAWSFNSFYSPSTADTRLIESRWSILSGLCDDRASAISRGAQQSPIPIDTVAVDRTLHPLLLNWPSFSNFSLFLEVNKSLRVVPHPYVAPSLFDFNSDAAYVVTGIDFHSPSLHTVGGSRRDLELIIAHELRVDTPLEATSASSFAPLARNKSSAAEGASTVAYRAAKLVRVSVFFDVKDGFCANDVIDQMLHDYMPLYATGGPNVAISDPSPGLPSGFVASNPSLITQFHSGVAFVGDIATVVSSLLTSVNLERGPSALFTRSSTVALSELMPVDRSYVTYLGSLPYPPCTEDVRYYLLEQSVPMSMEQLSFIRAVLGVDQGLWNAATRGIAAQDAFTTDSFGATTASVVPTAANFGNIRGSQGLVASYLATARAALSPAQGALLPKQDIRDLPRRFVDFVGDRYVSAEPAVLRLNDDVDVMSLAGVILGSVALATAIIAARIASA